VPSFFLRLTSFFLLPASAHPFFGFNPDVLVDSFLSPVKGPGGRCQPPGLPRPGWVVLSDSRLVFRVWSFIFRDPCVPDDFAVSSFFFSTWVCSFPLVGHLDSRKTAILRSLWLFSFSSVRRLWIWLREGPPRVHCGVFLQRLDH